MTKIAIFASGNGSNAINLYNYFNINFPENKISVDCIICNSPKAGIIAKSKQLGIPIYIYENSTFKNPEELIELLKTRDIDYIVLAGFLRLIPQEMIRSFPDRIINIHPSLLPKYGGKGMYGQRVHEAVIAARELESGITIHLVNEEYDKGKILKQAVLKIESGDDAQILAGKIHELEYIYFPEVVKEYISSQTA